MELRPILDCQATECAANYAPPPSTGPPPAPPPMRPRPEAEVGPAGRAGPGGERLPPRRRARLRLWTGDRGQRSEGGGRRAEAGGERGPARWRVAAGGSADGQAREGSCHGLSVEFVAENVTSGSARGNVANWSGPRLLVGIKAARVQGNRTTGTGFLKARVLLPARGY